MTTPYSSQVLASSLVSIEEAALQKILADYESRAQSSNCALSTTLLVELEAFIKRNRILSTAPLEENFCPDCAKAHLLKHAVAFGVQKHAQRALKKALPGVIGHQGYYLDDSELKSCVRDSITSQTAVS